MKEKTVTLADIARGLGVSKNAVSLALRGKDGVSDAMRERIIAKAREMQYHGLNKTQGVILALIPQRLASSESMFYHQLCFDMEAHASALGYQLIISSVSAIDESLCRPPVLLDTVNCMGIITVGNLSRAYCDMIYGLGMHYVMVDQYYDDVPVESVTTTNTSGAYLMTKHLIEHGHKSIQFLGNSFRTSSQEERWIGYTRAMKTYNLPVLENSLIFARGLYWENYEHIVEALNSMKELPTAFVCGHDMTAKHLICELAKRGLRCPEDFSVVGFDNIQSLEVADLHLTTYATPKTAIAHAAIELLQSTENRGPKRIQIFGEPIYRSSVKNILA